MKKISVSSQHGSLSAPASGGLQAALAFLIWGAFPLLFKQVDTLPALEVLAHRIVWALLFVLLLLKFRGELGSIARLLKGERRVAGLLLLSALLVSVNWLIFIWAVANDKVLESSLGYFINPLFNVVLGVLFLQERLRLMQWIAVIIAAAGVLYFVTAWILKCEELSAVGEAFIRRLKRS